MKASSTAQAEQARRAIGLIFLTNGVLFATWAVNIPGVRDGLHLNPAQIGAALLAVGLGSLLSMPLTGGWTARYGSAAVTRLSVLLSVVLLLLPFLMPNLPTLALALALFGASNGALDVAMNAQAVTIEKALGRTIMSRLHAYYSLGGVVGSVGGALLVGRVPLLAHAGLVVALGLLASGWAGIKLLPDASTPAENPTPETLSVPRFSPLVGLLGGLCALGMLAEGANYDWATLYYRDILGVAGGGAGLGYAAFVAAMTLGRWFGDHLRLRLSDQTTVRGGAWLTALGLALVLLVPHPVTATLGFVLSGLGLSNVVPVMYGLAGHALAGKGIAQVASIGYSGFLLGPPLIGFVAEQFGLRGALGLALLGAALVGGLSGWVFRLLQHNSHAGTDATLTKP